ncbi:hypothetical protein [Phytohabitans rumicis]|nr:hypothetical protein [Phytohabitans rumicis]
MTVRGDRCLARIRLGDDEVGWLSTRPLAAHVVEDDLYCELEMGHPGPHATMGQQGYKIAWWVRWTLSASEIVETTMCPAESDEVDQLGEHDLCLLYQGHPGRHSFEYGVE